MNNIITAQNENVTLLDVQGTIITCKIPNNK